MGFSALTLSDLVQFSSLYFINTTVSNIANIKKIVGSSLLQSNLVKQNLRTKKLLLDQNFSVSTSNVSKLMNIKNFLYLPVDTFFENNETFVNTEGLVKKTKKLIFKKKKKKKKKKK